MEYLSDIELFYTAPENISDMRLVISGEESNHIIKVMRHTAGEILHVTDGKGNIYKGEITSISGNNVNVNISEQFKYENKLSNITFCIPKLKSADRFEFALEKSVEMGITNFIIFESSRCIAKGEKTERWNKILLAAMKQSLRSFLPEILQTTTLKKLTELPGEKIVFNQNAEKLFKDLAFDNKKNYYLIFGPEGGLSEAEIEMFPRENNFKLADNRLRSETAIIKAASLI